jgi:hypothetical protein
LEGVMGYTILPQYDKDRYTPMKGLEGPFVFQTGKVLYYDPKEGKYYDRDTDFYVSNKDMLVHYGLKENF